MSNGEHTGMPVRPRWQALLLLAVVLLSIVALNGWWMHSNGFLQRPPDYDAATYRLQAHRIKVEFETNGVVAGLHKAFVYEHKYPPVLSGVTALVCAIAGVEVRPPVMWCVTAAFWLLLGIGVWRLATNFGGSWFALAVTAITVSCPVITTSARLFGVHVPMTAFLIWSLDALIRSRGFSKRGWTIACAAFVAIAMTTKVMAPVYVVGGFVVAIAAGLRTTPAKTLVMNLLLGSIVGLAILAPWYLYHWDRSATFVASRVTAEEWWSNNVGLDELQRWVYYPRFFVNSAMGLPLTLVLVFVGIAGLRRSAGAPRYSYGVAVMPTLVCSCIAGWLIITWGQMAAEAYYLSAFVPIAVIGLAVGIRNIESARLRRGLGVFVAVACVWLLGLSFRKFDQDVAACQWGGIHAIGRADFISTESARQVRAMARPEAESWPNRKFIELMAENSASGSPLCALCATVPFMIAYNLSYEAEVQGVDLRLHSVTLHSELSVAEESQFRQYGAEFAIMGEMGVVSKEDFLETGKKLGLKPEVLWYKQITANASVALLKF